MATEDPNLRGDHSYAEKLVWQGELNGVGVRVRIVQDAQDAPIETVIEKFGRTCEGIDGWIPQDVWEEPTDDHPHYYFVEGIIDLLGRPEWDTRAKVASSYPLELKVGIEW